MKNSMMKVSAQWDQTRKTFKLIPISLDSTFLECRFNLDEKLLVLLTKIPYQQYKMLPKLDDNGEVTYKAGKVVAGQKPVMKQERKIMDGFYDTSISERADIQKFVDLMTGEFNNLDEYFIVPEPENRSLEHEKALAATDGNPKTPKLTKVKES